MDKILVIDDELINLMIVEKILEENYEVKLCQSGEEAVLALKDFKPTLIMLDIHMPEMDGFDTLKQIRMLEEFSRTPIIFLTADDDVDTEVKGFQLGADDFIRKPFVSEIVEKRVQRSLESYRLHCNLQEEVHRQTQKAEQSVKELEKLTEEIIQALVTAIDAKDFYTKGHSTRVAEYSAIFADYMGWSESQVDKLRYKALLHDVGKIGVPDRVLNKAGRLSDEEFNVIKSHTTIGADILSGVSSLTNMYEVARNHHERFDGRGYPDALSGTDIPEEARIVGIADAYDAMSSDRVYRKALSSDIIREELIKGKGTQFDPQMLDLFLELFDSGRLNATKTNSEEYDRVIDLATEVANILNQNNTAGAMKLTSDEMIKLYKYIESIHARYGIEYNAVLISLIWEHQIEGAVIDKAMKAMEYSIIQSLRKVDVMTKVSESQYLIVLTEAHKDNIKMIVERIFAGFYRNWLDDNIKPIYEIK